MKRTDEERIAREVGRQQKQDRVLQRRTEARGDASVAGYTKLLESTLMWDDETVYNINDDEVLEVLMEMKEDLTDKECEAVIKRAIKKTKVKDRDTPFEEAMTLLDEA